jgi:HEAT repeat protein
MLLGSLSLLVAVLAQGDPSGLKSKDASVRVAALRELAARSMDGAEKALASALRDDDWEAVQVAADGLGALGSQHGFEVLADLALEGPVRAVRRAAAEALAKIDAERGYDEVAKKLRGELAPRACEALLALAPALDGKVDLDLLERASRSKDELTRRLAAAATVAVAGEERAQRLRDFLASEDLVLRASALEGAALAADARVAPVLLEFLGLDHRLTRSG